MADELQGQPQSGTESQETDPTTPVPGDPGYSDFYSGLLKDAPEEHRSIIEPYIKRFDAGVQRRFQDLHSQYRPYKELGWDEETLPIAAELYRMAQEEPERLLQNLQEYFKSQESSPTGGGSESTGTESIAGAPEVPGGIPPEIQERLDQQQKILEAVANVLTSQHTQEQQAAEDSEFERDLQLLREEFGDFDEKFVLARFIHNDVPLDAAIKEWQSLIQEEINKAASATSGLPRRVLSNAGGGAVPQVYQQNLGEIPNKDIRNLIAQTLANVNKE